MVMIVQAHTLSPDLAISLLLLRKLQNLWSCCCCRGEKRAEEQVADDTTIDGDVVNGDVCEESAAATTHTPTTAGMYCT